MSKLKINDLVITSRGLYGKLLSIEDNIPENKCIVKIGEKKYPIYESQIRKVEDFTQLKLEYESQYCGNNIKGYIILLIPKDFTIFDYNTAQGLSSKFVEMINAEMLKQTRLTDFKLNKLTTL